MTPTHKPKIYKSGESDPLLCLDIYDFVNGCLSVQFPVDIPYGAILHIRPYKEEKTR